MSFGRFRAENLPHTLALSGRFRYQRVVRRSGTLVLVTLLAASFASCSRARTPEEAYRRLAAAVSAGDGAALFDALHQPARWAWMSVQKYHREAYDIVLSNYPEPEREREKRRFEPAATVSSARELFKTDGAPRVIATLGPLLAAAGAGAVKFEAAPSGTEATAVLPSGARLPFADSGHGGWGYAGIDAEAEDQKLRAYHDLEVVRANAADYERAAARSSK
jgi:hypothetical protein